MLYHSFYYKALSILFICSTLLFSFNSCDHSKLSPTPDTQFVGTWELHGRSMFDGLIIEILKNEKGNLQGTLLKLNDNKYVEMFLEEGDIWVTNIQRASNYEFIVTEKKIAGTLFSQYGLSSSADYKVQFIDENTIGLGIGESDPTKSSVIYKRLNISQ